jgi:membrane-bound metal-dependent hydrolase YbcI (DUF457 family)
MNGPTHYLMGVYAGAGTGVAASWPLWQTATAAVIATSVAHGPTSPDGDQTWLSWTGRHRGVTHWWGWALLLAAAGQGLGPPGWPLVALAAGVASHLVGDALYGSPGVPLLPCKPWGFVGLRWRVAGRVRGPQPPLSRIPVVRQVQRWRRQVGHSELAVRWLLRWGLIPLAAAVVWQAAA